MQHTVIHVDLLPQKLESTGKPSQKMDSVTGSMQWEGMELFHVITTTRPTYKLWFPGKNMQRIRKVRFLSLDAARSQLITKNHHYLKTIVDVLLVCRQQEIVLRGHDESMKSLNRGNFLEISKLIAGHGDIIKERLACGSRNAIYTSPLIQKEFLHIMGEMIDRSIRAKARC